MTTTYVCSFKDIECSSNSENWCGVCPQWQLKTKSTDQSAKSQEALDEVLKSMMPKDSALPVHIYFTVVERSYAQIGFNAGEAYGRKQALEDAVNKIDNLFSAFSVAESSGYNEALRDAKLEIKELMK